MPNVDSPDLAGGGGQSPAKSNTADLHAVVAALTARVEKLEAARAPSSSASIAALASKASERSAELAAVESRIGGYWAARLGIVSLVTGLAFAIAHGFDHIGPILKAGLGYAVAATLAAFGRYIARRHQSLGTVVISGGLGVAYYTTYAIHHVPSVQLISSPTIGFALLAVAVLGIVVVAQRMNSETVAGLALFLGLHTGMVSQVDVFTLASGCLLAVGAGYFMVRNRWVIVPLSTLVAVYSTLLTWLLGNPLTSGAGIAHPPGHLATSLSFVALYYGTFAVAVAFAPKTLHRLAGSGFALLNWGGAAFVAVYELSHHQVAGTELAFAALAACSLGLAFVTARNGHNDLFHLHLALAAGSVALAIWAAFDGASLVIGLSAVGGISAWTARVLSSKALRGAAAVIAGFALVGFLANGADDVVLALAVVACLVAYERLGNRSELALDLVPAACVALVALTTATSLAPAALVTASWVGAGAAIFGLGLALAGLHYRLVALGVLALAFARLFLHDLAAYAASYRIISFLIAGALLLLVSYSYTRRAGASAPDPSDAR